MKKGQRMQHWAPWEENILRTKYDTNTVPQLHKRYLPHRTQGSIRTHLIRLGLAAPTQKTPATPWTKTEDKLLKENYGKKTIHQIQKEHLPNRTFNAIQKRISNLGLNKSGNHNTKSKSRTYNPWTTTETNTLVKHAPTMSNKELTAILPGKTAEQIKRKRKSLGLATKPSSHTNWADAEINIVKKHINDTPIDELTQMLPNRTKASVRAMRIRLQKAIQQEATQNANHNQT